MSWPTPNAQQFGADNVEVWQARRERVKTELGNGNGFGLTLNMAAAAWSTPKCSDGDKGGPNMRGSKGDQPLPSQAAQWATPRTISGGANSMRKERGAGGHDLQEQSQNWCTPMASDDGQKATSVCHQAMLCNQAEAFDPSSFPAPPIAGGSTSSTDGPNSNQPSARRRLNPIFVEALMRWPIGWTDFGCSETGSTLWRQHMRGYVSMLLTSCAESANAQGSLL